MLKELKIAFVACKKKLHLIRGKKKLPITDYVTPKISVKNALTPLLWVLGLIYGTFFGAAAISQGVVLDKLPMILIYIILLIPLTASLVAYFWFMFKDPNRLHSEDFQLKHSTLEMVGERGREITIAEASVLTAICNPHFQASSSKKEEEK